MSDIDYFTDSRYPDEVSDVIVSMDGVTSPDGKADAWYAVSKLADGTTAHHYMYLGGAASTVAATISSVSLDKTSASIDVDSTVALSATVHGTGDYDNSVTWSSSDENIATVTSSGVVNGISAGEATITATSVADNSKKGSVDITVTAAA